MLRTISGLAASELVSPAEGSVNEVGSGNILGGDNVDDRVNIVGNLNTGTLASKTGFLTPGAKLAFAKLRQAFVTAPILHHFDREYHIWIETDASGYGIGGVFSQLTLDNSGEWHPVAFFSYKMISAETRYKTHDGELLAIVEAFKTWRHYLSDCKYEVFVLTDHNNLHPFMDMKNPSSKQVW